ncbi:MAG: GNAT family N-acetyltransferase [Anaerolineae bacterium]|nr:GNAT family N-acetyltransferase [Anaerolineae bacterium]
MTANPYTIALESPAAEEYSDLRSRVGWGRIEAPMAQASLANSLFHVTVRDQDKLVGMGRVVGDGVMYFYIQDVVVDRAYQRQGIGHMLMAAIERYLAGAVKPGSTIGLLAAKGKEDFYTRYGYIERPNETLGNGMCKFI